jgi:phosphoglycerate kinase
MIKSIAHAELTGKRVLVRSDFNIPIQDGQIRSYKKINDSLPTIEYIIEEGGIPILVSHLGRPKPGERGGDFSLSIVADYFRGALGFDVIFVEEFLSEKARGIVEEAQPGQMIFFENLRFFQEEKDNDIEFARNLASYADVYCNNAFGTAHRAHASTHAITKFFEKYKYAGFLVEKEMKYFEKVLQEPERPFTAIIGGAKISGKIDVIKTLFDKCDNIIIGGGMMFTFYKALGYEIGKSLLEEDKVELAKELMDEAEKRNIKLHLPVDVVQADKFSNDAEIERVAADKMSPDMIGLDIGDESIDLFSKVLKHSKTVLWNGPMGVFEMPNFARGTLAIARALGKCTQFGGTTIVGGGDSARAITQLNYDNMVSHVSTGGGASLKLLEGKELPGVEALECAYPEN